MQQAFGVSRSKPSLQANPRIDIEKGAMQLGTLQSPKEGPELSEELLESQSDENN